MDVVLPEAGSRAERSPARIAAATVAFLFAAPPAAVLLSTTGLAFAPTLLVVALVAVGGAFWAAPRFPATLDEIFAGRRVVLVLWLLLGLAAVGRLAGVAQFAAEPSRPEASALPFDEFYVGHSCISAYYFAADMSRQAPPNLYDPAPYQETKIDRFRLDEYLYPPQFLLLPRAALALSGDFLLLRSLWFVVEVALLGAAVLALAIWIGGRRGTVVALLSPLLWLGTPTVLTLQIGNFQVAAFAISMLALVAFERRRAAAGGALLAFATVSKVFPGLLALDLLLRRRWRSLAWTAGAALAFSLGSLALLGPNPFRAFLGFQLPRIASGEAFAWLGSDELAAVAAINDSIPGLVWKLRLLGLGVEPGWVAAAGWLYTLALLGLVWLAARRMAGAMALDRARIWLALLTLAGLRSPFEPDTYALFGSLWLLTLWVADRSPTVLRIAGIAVAWLILATVVPFGGVPLPPPVGRALFTLLGQALTVTLSLWAVLAAGREGATEPALATGRWRTA